MQGLCYVGDKLDDLKDPLWLYSLRIKSLFHCKRLSISATLDPTWCKQDCYKAGIVSHTSNAVEAPAEHNGGQVCERSPFSAPSGQLFEHKAGLSKELQYLTSPLTLWISFTDISTEPLNLILWLHTHEVFGDRWEVYRSSVLPFHVITVWRGKGELRTEFNLVYERIFQTQKLIRKVICLFKG